MVSDAIEIAIEASVAGALRANAPVVALESTIITHGMPYPDNLATARDIEAVVRAAGATPATIAVIEGRIRIGLDPVTLEELEAREDATKSSWRDLAALVVRKSTGGTTVAATMAAAAMAGIEIFATGGIGGVHTAARPAHSTSRPTLRSLRRRP